jgi:hypothetical protein
MLVVALAALASGGWVLVKRSREYSKLATMYDQLTHKALNNANRAENYLRLSEQEARRKPILPQPYRQQAEETSASYRQLAQASTRDAQAFRQSAGAYRRAARHPWLGSPRTQ